jgi:hypothetical protein
MPDKQWEYRVDWLGEKTGTTWTDDLNRLGGEGWELVAVIGVSDNKCIFKREVPPDYSFLVPGIKFNTDAMGADGAQRPEPPGEGSPS